MAYNGERADAQALDQLEAILRSVADELAAWRTRALKAEAERGGGSARHDAEARNRAAADLESENKVLRQRVEAARVRVQDLLGRLTFLEEQARESVGGNGGGQAAGGSGAGGGVGGAGGAK